MTFHEITFKCTIGVCVGLKCNSSLNSFLSVRPSKEETDGRIIKIQSSSVHMFWGRGGFYSQGNVNSQVEVKEQKRSRLSGLKDLHECLFETFSLSPTFVLNRESICQASQEARIPWLDSLWIFSA